MGKSMRRRLGFIIPVVVIASLMCGRASADMTVIKSDDPKIAVGKKYSDDAPIDVAPGKTVQVTTADNKTKVYRNVEDSSQEETEPVGGTRGVQPDN